MTTSEALRLGFRIIAEPCPNGYSVTVEAVTLAAHSILGEPAITLVSARPTEAMEWAMAALERKARAA